VVIVMVMIISMAHHGISISMAYRNGGSIMASASVSSGGESSS